MYKQTPSLYELGSDDKIALIYAIDMALRNAENPIVIKKFEKKKVGFLLVWTKMHKVFIIANII